MKKPRAGNSPFQKQIGASADENPDTQPPIFSFEKMADKTGFSIECCDDAERSAFARRIFKLSQMIWRDIRQAPRHGLGSETIARASIKPRLPDSIPEDAAILALRYNGMKPMVGYRLGRVFYVMFLDHSFSVYDH